MELFQWQMMSFPKVRNSFSETRGTKNHTQKPKGKKKSLSKGQAASNTKTMLQKAVKKPGYSAF